MDGKHNKMKMDTNRNKYNGGIGSCMLYGFFVWQGRKGGEEGCERAWRLTVGFVGRHEMMIDSLLFSSFVHYLLYLDGTVDDALKEPPCKTQVFRVCLGLVLSVRLGFARDSMSGHPTIKKSKEKRHRRQNEIKQTSNNNTTP